ncbi:uncharacterized protein I303_105753 [Kwoniella dejecticola CBS 10117]|uniref:Elongator complex protein 5 n=1 Tax=Kwoniella dejecticola CBS 10117 TaxID=1296121 RepID=A0A1A6A0D4_9TREE|nr:uncharacterized protein I303_05775 [Kwoniella dejecticola CBS 10117]OBR83496.1 hypothetical protein I303_05775 [Kwoniella dejecticola CBS 10117]
MPARSLGDTGSLLSGVFDNVQIPHQTLCVINDGIAFSGLNVFKDILSRAIRRGEEITLISILHSPETLLPNGSTSSASSKVNVIDLNSSISGYGDEETIESIKEKILSTYTSGQIFIDALDILAEDYSSSKALSLVRNILGIIKKAKAPSRLVLLLPPHSTLYASLIPPTFNSTLTLLTPHPPRLVEHLSKSYLSPISSPPSPNLWMILENATKRSLNDDLSFKADSSAFEFDPTWTHHGGCAVVQVLIRKPTGGIKGISRSLEGVKLIESENENDNGANSDFGSQGVIRGKGLQLQLQIVPLDRLVDLNPFSRPAAQGEIMGKQGESKTHSELDLPFNLSLTDEQKRKRAEVPLPYAHEGEGASGDLIWEDEEETDDEEI